MGNSITLSLGLDAPTDSIDIPTTDRTRTDAACRVGRFLASQLGKAQSSAIPPRNGKAPAAAGSTGALFACAGLRVKPAKPSPLQADCDLTE